MKYFSVLLFLLAGCATVNVPTIESVMKDTYQLACEDTIASTVAALKEQGLTASGQPESCARPTEDFDVSRVKSYRSDFELIVKDRPTRDVR